MRIRKHAKLAGLSLTAGGAADLSSTPENSSRRPHICQLNQSPWDLLSFPPDSPSSPFQVLDGEESNYTANGSSVNSLEAVDSVVSMKISTDGEDKNVNHSKNGIDLGLGNGGTILCCKTVAKSWQRKDEAHPSAAPIRRPRGRPRKVPAPPPPPTTVNPYEYYYYSGFGPRWGKKRGASHLAKSERVEQEEIVRERIPHLSEIDSDEIDYIEDDDEEEEEEEDGNVKWKKMRRGRKPIKARSLKSLM